MELIFPVADEIVKDAKAKDDSAPLDFFVACEEEDDVRYLSLFLILFCVTNPLTRSTKKIASYFINNFNYTGCHDDYDDYGVLST